MNHDKMDWQNLDTEAQAARYQAIAGIVHGRALLPGEVPWALDVGCGTAVLAKYLCCVAHYIGIEPSQVAYRQAQEAIAARDQPLAVVFNTTAEGFAGGREDWMERWDFIIFNEVLYYARDPIGLLRQYQRLLAPGGRLIVSIYQDGRRPAWKARLRHLLDRRRPMSNGHCTAMVDAYARRGFRTGPEFRQQVGNHVIWTLEPKIP